jgi:hypothetical protein
LKRNKNISCLSINSLVLVAYQVTFELRLSESSARRKQQQQGQEEKKESFFYFFKQGRKRSPKRERGCWERKTTTGEPNECLLNCALYIKRVYLIAVEEEEGGPL